MLCLQRSSCGRCCVSESFPFRDEAGQQDSSASWSLKPDPFNGYTEKTNPAARNVQPGALITFFIGCFEHGELAR
jgi:hypothetical protein